MDIDGRTFSEPEAERYWEYLSSLEKEHKQGMCPEECRFCDDMENSENHEEFF